MGLERRDPLDRPDRDDAAKDATPARVRPLPFWRDDKHTVCERISARKGRLKFILKTKDERVFIKEWVDYYSKVVPLDNIIIFDNMSQDPIVLDYYDKLTADTLVIRYDGFHNYLHVVEMFPELYAALSASCDYFCILDSDEFLVLIDEGQFASTAAIEEYIVDQRRAALPSTWLANAIKSRTIFKCGIKSGTLEDGLKWGKPIVRAGSNLQSIILHNVQLDGTFYDSTTPAHLFLMHLTELYPEQRIRVNVAKLVARKFAAAGDTIEDIVAKSTDGIADDNVRLYLTEIKRLIAAGHVVGGSLFQGSVEIVPESHLVHFSEVEREVIRRFLREGAGRILANNAQ